MERGDELHVIGFDRIERGKPFDPGEAWFGAMLDDIGQPKTGPNFPAHQDVRPVSG